MVYFGSIIGTSGGMEVYMWVFRLLDFKGLLAGDVDKKLLSFLCLNTVSESVNYAYEFTRKWKMMSR